MVTTIVVVNIENGWTNDEISSLHRYKWITFDHLDIFIPIIKWL